MLLNFLTTSTLNVNFIKAAQIRQPLSHRQHNKHHNQVPPKRHCWSTTMTIIFNFIFSSYYEISSLSEGHWLLHNLSTDFKSFVMLKAPHTDSGKEYGWNQPKMSVHLIRIIQSHFFKFQTQNIFSDSIELSVRTLQ